MNETTTALEARLASEVEALRGEVARLTALLLQTEADRNVAQHESDQLKAERWFQRTCPDDTYKRAITAWGIESQLWMAVEECGELLAALNQHQRGRNVDVCGEIADVTIMCRQLAIVFGEGEVDEAIHNKLVRLRSRLDRHDAKPKEPTK